MQIESLQRSLDESKIDQQANHIQNSDQQVNQELQNRIDHLQNALAQEREKHRHQMQEALSTVGQEKSSLQIEIDNLKDTLSQSQAHSEQTKQALQNALFDAKEKHKKELLETFCKLEQEKQSLHLETEQLRATVSKLTEDNVTQVNFQNENIQKATSESEIEQLTAKLSTTEKEKDDLSTQLKSLQQKGIEQVEKTTSEDEARHKKEVDQLKTSLSMVQKQKDRLDQEFATLKHHHHRLLSSIEEEPQQPSLGIIHK